MIIGLFYSKNNNKKNNKFSKNFVQTIWTILFKQYYSDNMVQTIRTMKKFG